MMEGKSNGQKLIGREMAVFSKLFRKQKKMMHKLHCT